MEPNDTKDLIRKQYYIREDQVEELDKISKKLKVRSAAYVVRLAIDDLIKKFKKKEEKEK